MSFFTFVPASYFDSSLAKEIIISPKPTSHPLIPAATTSGPHKACELLLVSCNGSPLSDAVFTQKSQRHFSSWPQITKLIHHPHFQSTWLVLGDQNPLFFITVKCHDYRKVSCCPKTAIILFFFFLHFPCCYHAKRGQVIVWMDFMGTAGTIQIQGDEMGKHTHQVLWAGVNSARMAAYLPANCANTSLRTSSPPTTLSCLNFPSVCKKKEKPRSFSHSCWWRIKGNRL